METELVCARLDANFIFTRLIVRKDIIVTVDVNSLLHIIYFLFKVYSISLAVAQM
jgi:hypothetical protein